MQCTRRVLSRAVVRLRQTVRAVAHSLMGGLLSCGGPFTAPLQRPASIYRCLILPGLIELQRRRIVVPRNLQGEIIQWQTALDFGTDGQSTGEGSEPLRQDAEGSRQIRP